MFFTTSVLWQIVNLEEEEEEEGGYRNICSKRGRDNYLLIIQGRERDKYANKGRSMQLRGNRKDNVKSSRDRSDALNRAVPSFVYRLACLPATVYCDLDQRE